MIPRIPPAITFLVHFAGIWMYDQYTNLGNYHFPNQRVLALVLIIVGAVVFTAAIFTFLKTRTTLDPVSPERASTLITQGIFRWSRNPIYLTMLLWLMAWTLWLSNYHSMVFVITFTWFMTRFQIRAEEEALERKFGEAYQKYRETTRRWI